MLEFTPGEADREYALRPLLEAHFAYEHMSARRSFCVHLLALVSVLVWLGNCWPALLPVPVQAIMDECWGVLFFIAIMAGIEEWRCYRRLVHRAAHYPGAKLH